MLFAWGETVVSCFVGRKNDCKTGSRHGSLWIAASQHYICNRELHFIQYTWIYRGKRQYCFNSISMPGSAAHSYRTNCRSEKQFHCCTTFNDWRKFEIDYVLCCKDHIWNRQSFCPYTATNAVLYVSSLQMYCTNSSVERSLTSEEMRLAPYKTQSNYK